MGFVGVIFIISLFIFLIGRGLQISAKAPDLFGGSSIITIFIAIGLLVSISRVANKNEKENRILK